MTKAEREQLVVFRRLALSEISQKAAALILKMTPRWIRKKMKRFKEEGDAGIVHKGRGRASPKKWNPTDSDLLLSLLQGEWHGFGPVFAADKFKEIYGKKVSRETIRQFMIANNVEYNKRKHAKKRRRRERKEYFGMMVQLDGSSHRWFEDRGPECCLLVFIDDATSRILWLEFVNSESRDAVMNAAKSYFKKHGLPRSFYTDYGVVFRVATNNKTHDKITQFERALGELTIDIIHARSAQAKGRVERCNGTMQNRLVKEMRLAKVVTIEQANEFLKTSNFIEKHNARYAQEPAKPEDVHRSAEEYDLDNILCTKIIRTVMNDHTISYNNRILQITEDKTTSLRAKGQVVVHEYSDKSIGIF